jgi:PPK2 family polyphosphate:nucleotide phosphotransferase
MKKSDFEFSGKDTFKLKDYKTETKELYESKSGYEELLTELQESLDEEQNKLYAQAKYGILVIFQAMDAAGKDGTMRAVFNKVNPMGLKFKSFKRPTETELAHDYMWRCYQELPERGQMQVFNRSYYEEVLVVKVHPGIIENVQQLPTACKTTDIFEKRYADIRNFEQYLHHNGIVTIKFFLNISKKEQGKRLIERIEDPTKHWKFDENDIKERALWSEYQTAYQDMINATATPSNPWYIVPADDKKNMRIIVAEIIKERLKELGLDYPPSSPERAESLQALIEVIEKQNEE